MDEDFVVWLGLNIIFGIVFAYTIIFTSEGARVFRRWAISYLLFIIGSWLAYLTGTRWYLIPPFGYDEAITIGVSVAFVCLIANVICDVAESRSGSACMMAISFLTGIWGLVIAAVAIGLVVAACIIIPTGMALHGVASKLIKQIKKEGDDWLFGK